MPSTPTGELALAGVDAPIRFGKYTLLTRLATGGMGEVYVAQMGGAAGFEKQVVIKRILPQLANDEQFVQMFLDEARITAQLNHPNICQVFELGEINGEYYIAMEYLEGLPLSRLILKHAVGGIDLRVVLGIMIQACEGLAYAHDFRDPARRIDGVVHRDVSPQNLFVTAPGLVKVLDFGVAKLYREGSKTVTVSTKGKHLYMSPEQVNGDRIDQRSDLFALATVMFEALTGRSLFGRATQFLTLQAIVTGDRPRIREVRSDVPAAVEDVLERA
ncbi:MAG TPA: serine/threonine-protein kinase, partial [Haliangium sp.]|nr:serine/threonine-protein kinase [Haliangium sp.]